MVSVARGLEVKGKRRVDWEHDFMSPLLVLSETVFVMYSNGPRALFATAIDRMTSDMARYQGVIQRF